MHKIFLIIQREFISRVTKKSFLLATILVPLILPTVIGLIIYLKIEGEKNKAQETVRILDESGFINFEESKEYIYKTIEGPLDSAKERFRKSEDFAFIYIPSITLDDPSGISFYAKKGIGITLLKEFEQDIERQIRDIKLTRSGLTEEQLTALESEVNITSFNISETGDETKSDANSTFWLGYVTGFLIYIFLFTYGAQVMQGVIEEKSSKIVEVIVSTVKPFHMMIGKVVGVASIGVFQLLIWVVLMTVISIVGLSAFSANMTPAETAQIIQESEEDIQEQSAEIEKIISIAQDIPVTRIMLMFIFYFLGGYMLYGALFAAVGASVDTPADAQQFMMPIMIPIIVSLMGLFIFIFEDPNGPISFWLCIIPFTSPIAMMGRIGFGVPAWEIALSMVLLISGVIFTLWLAGRIYRIGILMHGTKVNYKVLAKWLKMKN